MKQLVLKILGARRNHYFFPTQQGRYQVGKGFTRTGTGFSNQQTIIIQRVCDSLSHGLLLGTWSKTRKLFRYWAIISQQFGNTLHRLPAPVYYFFS